MMATLSRMFQWRDALVIVKPDTLLRWHRKGFRLFWRWKSRPVGRPRLPGQLQELIRQMAAGNPTWGEERIANELKLKLGIRGSPRTVQKYLVVTATFRTLNVFVIMDLGSRKILHHNVAAHPTTDWTLRQFREALPGAEGEFHVRTPRGHSTARMSGLPHPAGCAASQAHPSVVD